MEDRLIKISTGDNRKATFWKTEEMRVSDLFEKLKTPVVGRETHDAYLRLRKSEQDDRKDVGGFVGGELKDGRRKANHVIGRDLVTLDFDHIPANGTRGLIEQVQRLGCCYVVYSTRKHCDAMPRLRVVIPTDRTMTPDEYEPVSRKLSEWIGMDMADQTTYQAERLMYWPSCCSDVPLFYEADTIKPLISIEQVLSHYSDWRDPAQWPGVNLYDKHCNNKQQEDPETKKGVVGAFCRAYDVYRAISELIPDAYSPVDNAEDRFTYTGGSTAGGAVIHDGGKFLYSHHATDPCSGRLVNAFDLVRLHKFGHKDDDAAYGTPVHKSASYKEMTEYAQGLDDVRRLIVGEKQEQVQQDFGEIAAAKNAEDESTWRTRIELDGNGNIKATIANYELFMENDRLLKDRIFFDELSGKAKGISPLPWGNRAEMREGAEFYWADSDDSGIRGYFERMFNADSKNKLEAAFSNHLSKHHKNKVCEYLEELTWDNKPRLDTLFIDYLGAEDNRYNRIVTRKAFVGAVARAMNPGCKFDCMLILYGKQGLGKSTILDKMSLGLFNDSIRTFEGKEASELLRGVWIVEIAELDAFRKSEVSCIKQFLSLRADRYRAAYGRNVEEHPRRCVFFGTTNTIDFLQDMTGNRRFWPVDVGVTSASKSVFKDLSEAEIAQIWAEAKARWRIGEELFLTGADEEAACAQQEAHREVDPWEPAIAGWLEKPIPRDWNKWGTMQRQTFWSGNAVGATDLVERESVSVAEIIAELLGQTLSMQANNPTSASRRIGAILIKLGWKRQTPRKHPLYGSVRPFTKPA